MKKCYKFLLVLLAAATMISCFTISASADTLKKIGEITYRYSNNGERLSEYTGWAKTANGSRFYYKDGVKPKNVWLSVKGERTYYLKSDGKMATDSIRFANGNTFF